MNIALLRMLQAQPDSYFGAESLARSLKITLSRIVRDLRELEDFGFGIEHAPHRGIRYTEPARRLCVDQIEWELGTRTIGRRIAVWQRTTSTNDLAARAARSRSNDGLVILAEEQTAGRGRRHRRWHAPPQSSVLMSVLVFPPEPVRSVALLTSLAAVAVADSIVDSLGLPARIKWPNDVRVEGKKVCGILVELLARGRSRRESGDMHTGSRPGTVLTALHSESSPAPRWRAAVVGIGVNVNIEPLELPRNLASPATSLMALCGQRLDRSALVRSLVQRLDHYYQLALTGDLVSIWRRWRELADLVGQAVCVERPGGEVRGRLVDIRLPNEISIELLSGKLIQLPVDEVLTISEFATYTQ